MSIRAEVKVRWAVEGELCESTVDELGEVVGWLEAKLEIADETERDELFDGIAHFGAILVEAQIRLAADAPAGGVLDLGRRLGSRPPVYAELRDA